MLKSLLPASLSERYGVFAGTNRFSESLTALSSLFSGNFNDSAVISEYEKQFAIATDAKHAIAFGAGRMALYAALQAVELKKGDEVILPAFTCVVVPNAFLYSGVVPIYVDIDSRTFNLDIQLIEEKISPRTKAIYLQNTFGLVSDFEAIRTLANRYHLILIEDAAHSLGATSGDKRSGSLGDIAFFSTDHSKVINTVVGGMVTTSRPEWADRLREIQNQSGVLSDKTVLKLIFTFVFEQIFYSRILLWLGEPLSRVLSKLRMTFFFSDEMSLNRPLLKYPYPCRLPSPLAKIGLSQLKGLAQNLKYRRHIATQCENILKANSHLSTLEFQQSAWLRYSFTVNDREDFENFMSNRFSLGTWFTSVVHGRNTHLEAVGYRAGSCPVAERMAQTVVNVPTHPRIKETILINKLKKYVSRTTQKD
ncbi:MAG: aminotransferase class I/II-fold pyridoxal phosphate-dependent enzyme [Proteobacteria bacterium]|nr:MAG: aminotransferase class I/II-fold pyridoxal phosphate-dependent enzyme [Pseudomonadota bacterium]